MLKIHVEEDDSNIDFSILTKWDGDMERMRDIMKMIMVGLTFTDKTIQEMFSEGAMYEDSKEDKSWWNYLSDKDETEV